MTLHPFPSPVPLLLDGSHSLLHARYFQPCGVGHSVGDVLLLPSFGEEMNRCRAMVARQARELAAIGIGTLVVDPYGTGDSPGDFGESTWDRWREDYCHALSWLRTNGQGCTTLWAARLGAVMASQIARDDGAVRRLVLWQPVVDAKSFYTQFLRIRIAAELNQADRVKSTAELRRRSAQGEAIEVSGYKVNPTLAQQLDETTFADSAFDAPMRSAWCEVLSDSATAVPPHSARMIAQLRQRGAEVDLVTSVGPAFWQVHERELAPDLISATTRWLREQSDSLALPSRAYQFDSSKVESHDEQPLVLRSDSEALSAVLHRGSSTAPIGVVIIVAGGPQYRAGAHRQFVTLARRLAKAGYPVLRFDLRGMGDSSGEYLGYQQSGFDIAAAVDHLLAVQPGLRHVALLGECESASGALFYAWRDPRVSALALINPWVRTEEGRAQAIVRHYYIGRLRSLDFWKQVFTGRFNALASLRSMVEILRAYLRGRKRMARERAVAPEEDISGLPLPVRTAEGLRRFRGRVLLLMSGTDLIAREFDEVTRASRAWDGLLSRDGLERVDIAGADHTFSREVWKDAAAGAVLNWLNLVAGNAAPAR